MKLFWQTCFLLNVLFGLIACNDTVPPPPSGAPVIEATNAKAASIGARGGRVSTTASNGVVYTLIVPPNALKETLRITLTPISSMGNAPLSAGVTAAVQMEPSGLIFQRSAQLQIGTVATVAAGKRLFGFSTANDATKFRFNRPIVKNGLTELSIGHFSDGGIGTATEAEIAQLPALEPLAIRTANDFNDVINDSATRQATDQEIVALFEAWFNEIVKPLILDAENSSDLSKMIDADLAFEKWFDARVNIAASSEGKVNVEPFLTDEDAIARPIVAKLLLLELNQRIETCKTEPVIADKFTALYLISLVQNLSLKFQMDTAALKLDAASISSTINDCVRVVIDPIKPFTQVVVGSDKSLDARAQVVFAGTPDPQGAGFAFKVSSSGATLKQATGFSSSDGRYTTVFTPNNKVFVLSIQACLVLPTDTEASSLCATQEVRSVVSDGIFRGTVTIEYHSTVTGTAPAVIGTTSDVTDVSVSASVSIDPTKLEIQVVPSNKNANYSHIKTGNVIISSTCTRQVFNISEKGSSLFLLPQESMFFIRFTDTAYSFSTDNPVGPTTTTGTITEQMVVTDRCIDVPPNDPVTRQVKIAIPRQSYVPERIFGTGTVITNASDGSKTISGTSTKTETLESSPGVTQTTNYTMTWNLIAFF
jgi:hypothetical protein